MIAFYNQRIHELEAELQALTTDRAKSSIETVGSYDIMISQKRAERDKLWHERDQEQKRLDALLPQKQSLDESHLPTLLDQVRQQLAWNSRRVEVPKLLWQIDSLFNFVYDEHFVKIKEGGTYKQAFDPKNFINCLFDEIVFGHKLAVESHLVGALGARTKLDIMKVRQDQIGFQYWERSVLVSGITLSLTMHYDLEKVHLLIDFVNDREPFVWKKALVGLFLILNHSEKKVKKDTHLLRKLQNLQFQADVQEALVQMSNTFDNLEENIDWLTKFSAGTKLQDFMEFFEMPQHWFIPFYENNAILEESDIEEPLKSLLTDSIIWNIDAFKYAFCKNFNNYSGLQNSRSIEILQMENDELQNFFYKSPNYILLAKLETEINCYLCELYYFFDRFPKEKFKNLFNQKIIFYNTFISQTIANAHTIRGTKSATLNATGKHYTNAGEYDKAISYYQKAIDIKDDNHNAFYNMGIAYKEKKNYDKAIQCYQKAIELKPDNHEAFNNMGNAYAEKKDYDKAISYYQKAIELKPDKYDAFYNMGIAYGKKKDYDKAISCYQKAIEIKPDNHDAFNNMGIAYYSKKDYDKAIWCYQKAIEIKPDNHDAFYNMGSAYAEKKDFDNAISCYQKAINIKPDYLNAYSNYGFTLIVSGAINDAEPILKKAIQLGDFTHSYMNLGHVYLVQNQMVKAMECYLKSLSRFKSKDAFWEGMQDDFQHLAQYGITPEAYEALLQAIAAHSSPQA